MPFLQQTVMIKAKYNFPISLPLLQSLDTEVMVSNNVMVLKAAEKYFLSHVKTKKK